MLVGREHVYAELERAIAATAHGRGGLVLLGGESGVGKTRLATEALKASGLQTLRATASAAAASPYGVIVAALRECMRESTTCQALTSSPMAPYLSVLLPELGTPPEGADRPTVFEAVQRALQAIADCQPTVLFLDDLQWADYTTLELLAHIAPKLEDLALLVLGAYRTDELSRDHPLRRLRADLRRAGLFRELSVEPLSAAETASMASALLGSPPSPDLAVLLHAQTDGLPLFVEELVAALNGAGRLHQTDRGVVLADAGSAEPVPVPDTVRDVVLLRTATLSDAERVALEVASVVGTSFDLDVVADLAGGEEHLEAVFALGLLVEASPGHGAFRHALIREACYREITWSRRRALHRQVAERLERQGAAASALVEHWLAAREPSRARVALQAAMDAAWHAYAYRDALAAGQRALELWPEGESEAERTQLLDRVGYCAQMSGDLAEAARAWRDVAETHRQSGNLAVYAETQRRLAGAYSLQASWERALSAREAAASAFAATGQPAEAASERLAAAAFLRSALRFEPALELLGKAAAEAATTKRLDLQARIISLEGNVRARMGQHEVGLERVRSALALALEHNLSTSAAEAYQRLADSLEHAGEYAAARQTYLDAADFCQAQGVDATAQICLACLTAVLRQTGEWAHCAEICRTVLSGESIPQHARAAASGILGLVHAHRGEAQRARPLLQEGQRIAHHIGLGPMQLLSAWGLMLVDDLEGSTESAFERGRQLLELWSQTDERHYIVPALRWMASFFAVYGAHAELHACANGLARIVAEAGTAESVAALGHALAEICLLDGNLDQARQHFDTSIHQLDTLELPYERAHTAFRAGQALVASGARPEAIERLTDAYRRARNLGARPLMAMAARELAALGELVERRVGRRAAGLLERAGLTRREVEIVRLVARGQTNREIAHTLVLSPRTVEMHVANSLGKLGCRSRAEAVRRAAELGLLELAAAR